MKTTTQDLTAHSAHAKSDAEHCTIVHFRDRRKSRINSFPDVEDVFERLATDSRCHVKATAGRRS